MLTRAKLRDGIAARTGYEKSVVAHVLDVFETMVEEEILQQGEVALRGLFRIVPVVREYAKAKHVGYPIHAYVGVEKVRRIILTIRPVRSLRRKLSEVPLSD